MAKDIPELKELYSLDIHNYDFVEWSHALDAFLGCRFTNWRVETEWFGEILKEGEHFQILQPLVEKVGCVKPQ
ncbi:hypothetical protein BSPWISOXPB_4349 [uncultured Gammaproteobacteria bacterium]|nr:hypothetical protein BSPWISOXPB_4349 [uncultured Gammaproteobacteria bacterium]